MDHFKSIVVLRGMGGLGGLKGLRGRGGLRVVAPMRRSKRQKPGHQIIGAIG